MNIKIYYKPDDLSIFAITDGEESVSAYPFINYECEAYPHTSEELFLEKVGDKIEVKINNTYPDGHNT